MSKIRHFMEEALDEARMSLPDDVPVGAVIVHDGKVIARAHNMREKLHSPSGHAEIIAAEAAAKVLGDWRLQDCDMYVTLEPCPMCAGLLKSARLRSLYFGAYDPEAGAAGSAMNLLSPAVKIYPLILAGKSKKLLDGFFAEIRAGHGNSSDAAENT